MSATWQAIPRFIPFWRIAFMHSIFGKKAKEDTRIGYVLNPRHV